MQMFDLRKNTLVPLEVPTTERLGCSFDKGFLQNIQLERAPLSPCAVVWVPSACQTFTLKRLYAHLQRLSIKLYSTITKHQQSADK